MTVNELAEKAVEYKHNGSNCAQAVIRTLVAHGDLGEFAVDEEKMVQMASGFGVGMGCMEATCGALVGANMVVGLAKNGKGTMGKSSEILKEFQEQSGATICKVLKGKDTGVMLCSCDDCVRNAVKATMTKMK